MEINHEESEFKWLEAAKSYEKKLKSETPEIVSIAQYWQRIGFCYGLASRQVDNNDRFRELEKLAVESYEQAAEMYQQDFDPAKNAESKLCQSNAEYNRSWIASNPLEKRKMLEKCLDFGKAAQKIFKRIDDKQNFGKTCNTLALCAYVLDEVVTKSTEKKTIIQEGLNYANTAVSVFTNLGNKEDLILALSLSSLLTVSFSDISLQKKNRELCHMALIHSKKAIELSKEVNDPYSKAMAFWAGASYTTGFEEEIEKRKSLEYPREMLREASTVRDNFLKGIAYYYLAYALYADAREEQDPDTKKQKYLDIPEYCKNAERCLQLVSQDAETAKTCMFSAENYLFLAKEFAVTRSEKLSVLKKAVRAGEKGLEYSVRSGSARALEVNFVALARVRYYYSLLTHKKAKRIGLLEEALKYVKKGIATVEASFPLNFWYVGVGMADSAKIEAELARLDKNKKSKASLFEHAVTFMERGISECKRTLEFADVPAVRIRIADYEDTLGVMLEEYFYITVNKENLKKANDILSDAALNFRKIGLPSRAAESYWKIAQNHDRLGNYQKAAENFDMANIEYNSAASRIPQLNDFYLDYAAYVKAWAEIEKAKLAHYDEEYGLAKRYYENAASCLKQSKSWMHFSANFQAWSMLEQAEDLSRKESSGAAIKAFEEAINFFRESSRILTTKLDKIQKTDEKDLIQKLIEVSYSREKYSLGRIAVEEAKILDQNGDHENSSTKYEAAALIFSNLTRTSTEQIGKEARSLFYLCKAWEKLTMAEARVSSNMYTEAAELFKLANVYAINESSSQLTLAHSSFCRALAAGAEFEMAQNRAMYAEAKKYLSTAANYYVKAGFESFSEYVKATECLFNAYFYMNSAKREEDPDKEAKYYLMAEELLKISSQSYNKTKYTEKANQVQKLLKKIEEERELAISLSDVLYDHNITASTSSFGTLSLVEEKAVGLERFVHSDIQANLAVEKDEVKVGENLSFTIQVVNDGKESVQLTKIENVVPNGFQLIGKPDFCSFEEGSVLFKGRYFGPLKTEELNFLLGPYRRGFFEIKPRLICVDERGRQLFHSPDSLKLRVLENAIPGRLETGFSDLDDLLLGGIPENYAVVLSSPSTDEREGLVNRFLETGAKNNQFTFYLTTELGNAKSLVEGFRENFFLLLCNPTADVAIDDAANVVKLKSVENLTEISISILKILRNITASKEGPRRFCLGILSDVLLQHRAVITRKWLSSLLPDLKLRGFTTMAVVNRQMHPIEETEAVTSQFDGEIQIFEREIAGGLQQVLRIRKLHNQRYLENEIILPKELKSADPVTL